MEEIMTVRPKFVYAWLVPVTCVYTDVSRSTAVELCDVIKPETVTVECNIKVCFLLDVRIVIWSLRIQIKNKIILSKQKIMMDNACAYYRCLEAFSSSKKLKPTNSLVCTAFCLK